MRQPLEGEASVPGRTTIDGDDAETDEGTASVPRGVDQGSAATGLSESFERWLPVLAIAAMIATFLILPPSYAMTLIALIWLVGTRLSASRRLLGLTLTEALAWVATVAIAAFLSLVLIFVLGATGGA